MNLLLFYPNEVCKDKSSSDLSMTLLLSKQRAKYAIERHQLSKPGLKVKAGILNGKIGTAQVLEITNFKDDFESTELKFSGIFDIDPPNRSNCDILVGVPRPQTVKKIIQVAISFGVENIFFQRMEKTVPSYCQSNIFKPENLDPLILESLEQVCDTKPSNIILQDKPNYFARSDFQKFIDGYKDVIVFDGEFESELSSDVSSIQADITNGSQKKLLIFGPEAGFSERERAWLLQNSNINKVSLGERMLRLEYAVCAALWTKFTA